MQTFIDCVKCFTTYSELLTLSSLEDIMPVASHHSKLVEQFPGNLRAGCTGCSWGCNRCLVATVGMTVQYTVQIRVTGNISEFICVEIFKLFTLLKRDSPHKH